MRILLGVLGAVALLVGVLVLWTVVSYGVPVSEALTVWAVSLGVGLGVPLVVLLVNSAVWLIPLLLLLILIRLVSRSNRHA